MTMNLIIEILIRAKEYLPQIYFQYFEKKSLAGEQQTPI